MTYDDGEAAKLLRAAVAGEEAAFTRLYGLTSPRVAAYLSRLLRDRTVVEDVMIETYVEVWRNAAKFKGGSMVITWIIGIARNLAMNNLKRTKTYASMDDIAEPAAPASTADEAYAHRQAVTAGLNALSAQHREILALALLREFSYEQISNLLAIPVNTVKTRVFYAKTALREQLGTIGITRDDVL